MAHWRNTMKDARFFAFDAKAAGPVLFFMMHIRLWTLIMFLIALMSFWVLEKKGLSFSSSLRAFRVWLLGARRPALLWTKKRRLSDTGSV